MKYFIIHSGTDYDKVKEIVEVFRKKASHNEYDVFSERVENWHDTAKERIESSDGIIFFVNSDTHLKENIEYELSHAIQRGKKIFIYKLSRKCRISYNMAAFLNCDTVLRKVKSSNLKIYSNVSRMVKVLCEVHNSVRLDVELCNENANRSENLFLQQYLMFVKTSEDLVKRKQNLNNLYITLNSAILGIIATIVAWNVKNMSHLNFEIFDFSFTITIKSAAVTGIALFGVLICYSWRRILKIYDNLNSSKMSVIIDIEKQLPLNLFAKEWQYVVDRDWKRRYRSFSKSERVTAVIFLIFYCVVMLLGIWKIIG